MGINVIGTQRNQITIYGRKVTNPVTIRSEENIRAGDTLSLRRVITSNRAQRWRLSLGLAPMYDGEQIGEVLDGIFSTHKAEKFSIEMPQVNTYTGPALQILTETNGGSDYIPVAKGSGNLEAVRCHGNFVTIGADKKVYFVRFTGNVRAGTGTAVKIYPALVQDAPTAAALNFNPNIQVLIDDLPEGITVTNEGLVFPRFNLVEFLE